MMRWPDTYTAIGHMRAHPPSDAAALRFLNGERFFISGLFTAKDSGRAGVLSQRGITYRVGENTYTVNDNGDPKEGVTELPIPKDAELRRWILDTVDRNIARRVLR